jgi:hypothetical protein
VDETKLQINVMKKYKLDETLFMAEIDDQFHPHNMLH